VSNPEPYSFLAVVGIVWLAPQFGIYCGHWVRCRLLTRMFRVLPPMTKAGPQIVA
jgi:hypothetical protein